jgi:ABC-type dipeptide/oligopeptide/nickel transport system ATPase component
MVTLRRVQDRIGAAVILIGHDMGLMAQFAQRVAVMRQGQIVETGEVRQVFAHPNHPYTRLLMNSLPSLDPASRQALLGAEDAPAAASTELAVSRDEDVKQPV